MCLEQHFGWAAVGQDSPSKGHGTQGPSETWRLWKAMFLQGAGSYRAGGVSWKSPGVSQSLVVWSSASQKPMESTSNARISFEDLVFAHWYAGHSLCVKGALPALFLCHSLVDTQPWVVPWLPGSLPIVNSVHRSRQRSCSFSP